MDNRGVFGGARDTVIACEKEHRSTDADEDGQPANHCKDTHVGLQGVRVPSHYSGFNTGQRLACVTRSKHRPLIPGVNRIILPEASAGRLTLMEPAAKKI